jgi:hypothetical protein
MNEIFKSKIIDVKTCNNLQDIINRCYKIFRSQIKYKLPRLEDKKIVINDLDLLIDGKPEAYWHMISLSSNERFNILPCNNDHEYYDKCDLNCIKCSYRINLSHGKCMTRNVCVYRAVRILWLNEVINSYNSNHPRARKWVKNNYTYLRYNNGSIDYVCIFKENEESFKLVANYPVFYINVKETFDIDYENYIKIQNT